MAVPLDARSGWCCLLTGITLVAISSGGDGAGAGWAVDAAAAAGYARTEAALIAGGLIVLAFLAAAGLAQDRIIAAFRPFPLIRRGSRSKGTQNGDASRQQGPCMSSQANFRSI